MGDEYGRGRGILSNPGNGWTAPDVIRIHEQILRKDSGFNYSNYSFNKLKSSSMSKPANLCLLEMSHSYKIFPEAS